MVGNQLRRAVSKFGGSSVADSAGIARVAALANTTGIRREHLVVSAPGKRDADDIKVTDMLLDAHTAAQEKSREGYDVLMERIARRFSQLSPRGDIPALTAALDTLAAEVYDDAASRPSSTAAFAASRGEYLNGLVVAHATGFEFIDPADDFIIFTESRELDLANSLAAIRRRCAGSGSFVIPGFFGGVTGVASPAMVATFSRGGSDVTASVVAAALAEDEPGLDPHNIVHENFTDVDGVLSADPRVCPGATRIPKLSYQQTRTLALAGAAVLHPDAVTPLLPRAVPLHVRSTWEPHGDGTWISEAPARLELLGVQESDESLSRSVALSVAGRATPGEAELGRYAPDAPQVTVTCKDVGDDATRGERAMRALRARVESALDSKGIARLSPAFSPPRSSAQSVHLSIANREQLNDAVAAVFDSIHN